MHRQQPLVPITDREPRCRSWARQAGRVRCAHPDGHQTCMAVLACVSLFAKAWRTRVWFSGTRQASTGTEVSVDGQGRLASFECTVQVLSCVQAPLTNTQRAAWPARGPGTERHAALAAVAMMSAAGRRACTAGSLVQCPCQTQMVHRLVLRLRPRHHSQLRLRPRSKAQHSCTSRLARIPPAAMAPLQPGGHNGVPVPRPHCASLCRGLLLATPAPRAAALCILAASAAMRAASTPLRLRSSRRARRPALLPPSRPPPLGHLALQLGPAAPMP